MGDRLAGRVAVVTGGCSGIGLATVRRFAQEGATVVIGDLDDTRGPGIAEEVGGAYVRCDVTDKEQVDALFATAKERFGSVDVAFNNASGLPGGRTEIALFHYALDGLMLDHITAPIDTGLSVDTATDEFVDRILQ